MQLPHLRRLNSFERIRLLMLASRIRREVDAEMADAVERIADGDDAAYAAYAALHDRCTVAGRHDIADRVRRHVQAN